jgi:hypothetical protein
MIIYQGTTGYRPAKHPYQDLASASATDRAGLLHSTSVMAQGGETADTKEPVQVSPPREARSRQDRRSQTTVLVIDDEEPVRETRVEVLSFHSYNVITAASVGTQRKPCSGLALKGLILSSPIFI